MFNTTQNRRSQEAALSPIKRKLAGRIIASINMTDEEARKQLPQIAMVVEDYQRNRARWG